MIRNVLEDFVKNDLKAQLIFNSEHDRYLVMHNEWKNDHRVYGCAIQIDIIKGQIWLQQNSTEIYIDRELIQLGAFPQDMIFSSRHHLRISCAHCSATDCRSVCNKITRRMAHLSIAHALSRSNTPKLAG